MGDAPSKDGANSDVGGTSDNCTPKRKFVPSALDDASDAGVSCADGEESPTASERVRKLKSRQCPEELVTLKGFKSALGKLILEEKERKASSSPEMRALISLLFKRRSEMRQVELLRSPLWQIVCPPPASCRSKQIPETQTYWVRDKKVTPNCPLLEITPCQQAFLGNPVRAFQAPPAIFYVHGGCFCSGDLSAYKAFLCRLCKLFGPGTAAFFVQYRVVPEYSIEDSLVDVRRALREFEELTGGANAYVRRVLVADGAGAFHLLTALRMRGPSSEKRAAAPVVLISPWLDLTLSGPSYAANRDRDAMFFHSTLRLAARMCRRSLEKHAVEEGTLQPPWHWLFELQAQCGIDSLNLPPTLILTSETEMVRDDALSLFAVLKSLGCEVKLKVSSTGFHSFPIFHKYVPEGEEALEQVGLWVRERWAAMRPRPRSRSLESVKNLRLEIRQMERRNSESLHMKQLENMRDKYTTWPGVMSGTSSFKSAVGAQSDGGSSGLSVSEDSDHGTVASSPTACFWRKKFGTRFVPRRRGSTGQLRSDRADTSV